MSIISPKVAGLFAGIGGIELGFQDAGFTVISANEIDEFAGETYRHNHKHKLILKDIAHLEGKELSQDIHGKTHKINVLTGGFPCQPFSVAGHRKGFDDARGNVFWEIHRLISELGPDVVLLENVKNLVGHDSGRTFATIQGALEGKVPDPNGNFIRNKYFVKTAILNSKDFGIPQNRERIYIVAFKSKQAFEKFRFPAVGLVPPGRLSDFIDFNKRVPEKYYYREDKLIFPELEKAITGRNTVYQWRRQYVRENKSNLCPTLTANMGMGGHNVPLIFSKHGIRKLTPNECFRLMGIDNPVFPDGMADSRLYKQAGNAVVVPVVKAIARKIMEALD
jgi:DNA (cytosine-5)-methyltransferase 1